MIRANEFKERYSAFCFSNGYTAKTVRDEEATLETFGMTFITQCDGQTEVYRRIRFKTKREQSREDEDRKGDENSLTWFTRTICMVTMFDSDSLPCKSFVERYNQFCYDHGCEKLPVTKRAMSGLGAIFERQVQNNIESSRRRLKVHSTRTLEDEASEFYSLYQEVIRGIRPKTNGKAIGVLGAVGAPAAQLASAATTISKKASKAG